MLEMIIRGLNKEENLAEEQLDRRNSISSMNLGFSDNLISVEVPTVYSGNTIEAQAKKEVTSNGTEAR